MSGFGERLGWWGAAAFAVFVGGRAASADTIYLNARGVAQREQIQQGIQPARLFDDANGVYLRCRVISATPAAYGSGMPTLQIEAWSQVGPDRYVWSAQPYTIGMTFVRSVEHEVDSHLDLQLMLSSRDEPDAPIGSAAWATRLRRVLDPGGAIGLSSSPALDPETEDERRAVTRPGWLMHYLVEDPLPVLPDTTGPGGERIREEYQRVLQERQRRVEQELRADGIDALHPRRMVKPARQAVWGLVEGIARSEKFRFLAERQARNDEPPPLPPRADDRIGRDFVERATIATGFLCTLSEVRAPEPDPRAVVEPLNLRYSRFGFEARDALLTVLEAADPDHVAAAQLKARATARMAPGALLELEPAETAMVALRVIQEFETFWYADQDARRLARALLRLARQPGPGSTPASFALGLEARETLVRMLRPDMRPSALQPKEEGVRKREAARFRAVMDEFVTEPDPAVREAVQAVLVHAGFVPVSTEAALDELFSLATGDGVPMDAPRTVKRATRRYAITILSILGGLAGSSAPEDDPDRVLAEQVMARLQVVRDRVEGGLATDGQRELIDMLPRLHERVDEPALRARVRRFLRNEADYIRVRQGRARMLLEEAANGTRVLSEEDRTRLFDEARRFSRRLDGLRVPDAQ